ncbi:class IV adenylate cyclase [Catenulispora subtropica]|uniref:CYTH domain-containing protein n=1 Tax=Catenulispora subtropica TaxID=450798 RepID=A0ABP5ERS2_9ACTN
MAIEAELKARVTDPETVLRILAAIAPGTSAIYQDQYFDSTDGSFTASGRELRIRTVDSTEAVRHILTFKAPAVDAESGSKPEYETLVADPDATAAILLALGYRALVSFSKHCANHRMQRAGRDMLATVVTVPEIDGTFLEVETLTDDASDVPAALAAVHAVMTEVGIAPADFTTELYTEAVLRARPGNAV